MKKYFFILSITVVIFISHLMAQNVPQLTGAVVDAVTGKGIPDIAIRVSDTPNKAKTNAFGGFTINNLTQGSYTLNFSGDGYQQRQITIQSYSSSPLQIVLQPNRSDLGEVNILGRTQAEEDVRQVKNNVMPVTVITAKQIENRAGNLNEILARQAGVQIRQSGGLGSETRISVRGLEGKRVQIFIDGNPLNTPDGSLGINDLPLQVIERIDIYKGSVPAWLGGDGLGSAVNVIFKHRDMSYIDATVSHQSYNTKNVGLILKKTFDKPGIEFGVGVFDVSSDNNYTMASPYQPGLTIKREHDKYHSLLTGASIRFHKLWFDEIELEGAYIKIDKQIQGIQQNIQSAESKGNSGVIALNLKKEGLLGNRLSIRNNLILAQFNVKFIDTSSFNYNWDGSKTVSLFGKGELGIGPNLSTNLQNEIRQRFNANYILSSRFTINLNNAFRYGTLDPTDTLGNRYAKKNLFDYPGNLRSSVTGLTIESRFYNDRLLLSTALKHYYNQVNGYNTNIYVNGVPDKVNNITNTLGYNAGLRYNFTDNFLLKASHERAVRFPINGELFGDGVLITPALFLRPEVAYNNSIGLVYDHTNNRLRRLQIEANAFYMNVDQLIQLSGNGLSLGYVNYAKARIIGADIDLKSDIANNLYASLNVTWQQLTDNNRYIPGTQNVANPTYGLTIPNTPRFFSNLNVEYHRDNLIGQRTRTRLMYDGSYVHQFSYGFNISQYDSYFIPSYTIHTLSVEQAFADRKYTLTAEVNNVLNTPVINNYNQPLPGRTFRIKLRYLLLAAKKSK